MFCSVKGAQKAGSRRGEVNMSTKAHLVIIGNGMVYTSFPY